MSGDIEEAERIARLLEAELKGEYDALKEDFQTLSKRANLVSKWKTIAAELKAPAESSAKEPSDTATLEPAPPRTTQRSTKQSPETKTAP